MVSSKLKTDLLFCHIRKQWVAALPEEHVRQRLKEAIDFPGPVVIHAEVIKEDNVFPMIPAGKSAYEMIIEPPKKDHKLEKPTGST